MIERHELYLSPEKAVDFEDQPLSITRYVSDVPLNSIRDVIIVKKSIDARQRKVKVRLVVDIYIDESHTVPTSSYHGMSKVDDAKEVLIVGAGPAGYFAALRCLELGLRPIILERGKDVRARRRDLRAIQQFGEVNEHSNYCFGEGGAGTYSDGKLYTRSKKRGKIENILRTLVEHGAPDAILYDAHPHIGSNILPKIITNIRQTILDAGGMVLFEHYVTDLIIKKIGSTKKIIGLQVNQEKEFFANAVILATGHSARDIFKLLHTHQIRIESKPFALGVRIEHPQPLIDQIQYKQKQRGPYLPAASYSLVCQVDGEGVFSFCMCPGGLIVPAATSPGELVVNGMSLSRRDSPYSNSGMVVSVDPSQIDERSVQQMDGYEDSVFIGLNYQAMVERKMFEKGDGTQKAPAQRIVDFCQSKQSSDLPDTSYIPGVYSADMSRLLPNTISKKIQQALPVFGKKMKGYFTNDAQIVGVESRTSSPIRIPRDSASMMHNDVDGLFPCGEGAGFAGGIVSAAMDGENVGIAVSKYLT